MAMPERLARTALLISLALLVVQAGSTLGHSAHQDVSLETRTWLDFNHHLGGFMVLILAGLTWLEVLEVKPAGVIKLGWPACLLLIGGYNLIASDRFAWPIGPSGLVESLSIPVVLQHKMLAVAVLALGVIELLRRLRLIARPSWLSLFYGIAFLTGGLLLLHAHAHGSGTATSHVLMGVLALLALACKVLVDHGLIVGRVTYLYPVLLLGLSVQLLLFTEPAGVGQ